MDARARRRTRSSPRSPRAHRRSGRRRRPAGRRTPRMRASLGFGRRSMGRRPRRRDPERHRRVGDRGAVVAARRRDHAGGPGPLRPPAGSPKAPRVLKPIPRAAAARASRRARSRSARARRRGARGRASAARGAISVAVARIASRLMSSPASASASMRLFYKEISKMAIRRIATTARGRPCNASGATHCAAVRQAPARV